MIEFSILALALCVLALAHVVHVTARRQVAEARSIHADHLTTHDEILKTFRAFGDVTRIHEDRIARIEAPWANN